MNTSTKVFATLSLSAAVGQKINGMDQSNDDQKALGQSLYDVGYEATRLYPYPALSVNKTNQILDAVESLLSVHSEPPVILSMLIAGLVDIHAKCKPERKIIIDPVIYCAQACLDSYDDDNVDHSAAFERYERWVSA